MTYFDSSFIVSLHCLDGNSKFASRALSTLAGYRILTELCQLETVNAINLRIFRKEVTPLEALRAIQSFDGDLSAGMVTLLNMPQSAFPRAIRLSQQYSAMLGTRSADILHVAAALELGADSFFSFDTQQRRLAKALGLILNSP